MSKKTPDLNDKMLEGFSISEMLVNSTPMETDKLVVHTKDADSAVKMMKRIARDIKKTEDKAEKLKIFMKYEDKIDEFIWAWFIDQKALTPYIFEIRPLRGMAKHVDRFIGTCQRGAKKIEKKLKAEALREKTKRIPTICNPDQDVWDMLDKKAVLVNGEFSHWDGPFAKKLNMERILRHDPNWAGRIKGCTFDGRTHLMSPDKTGRLVGEPVTDNTEAKIGSWVADVYGIELEDTKIGKIMSMIGSDSEYHPVKDYLMSLTWDGTPRLKDWVSDTMQSPDHQDDYLITDINTGEVIDYEHFFLPDGASITQIYGIRWFISAVARAMKPGCKVDTLLCMINPKQGSYKSTTCRTLATRDEWNSMSGFDMKKKDAFISIQGKWIVELQECESLHRSGFNTAKSFLSSQQDRFRTPYDRHAKDVKRTCVFIATTNQSRLGFLNDVSGHRRYWVMRVGNAKINDLKANIDQLWAEATWHYLRNERWWLDDNEDQVREILNDRFREVDSWEEEIVNLIYLRLKRDIPSLITLIDEKYGVDLRGNPIEDKFERYEARIKNWTKLDSFKKEKLLVRHLSFTQKSIMEAMEIEVKDQRQAEMNRMGDIFTRIGVKKGGRTKVGRAHMRTWWLDPAAFKEMLFNNDYESVRHLLEAPMDESANDREDREWQIKLNPLLAYVNLSVNE